MCRDPQPAPPAPPLIKLQRAGRHDVRRARAHSEHGGRGPVGMVAPAGAVTDEEDWLHEHHRLVVHQRPAMYPPPRPNRAMKIADDRAAGDDGRV